MFSAGEVARAASAGASRLLSGKVLYFSTGIDRAPVGEFLDRKGAYLGMCCTHYMTSETAVCGWTKRKIYPEIQQCSH